MSGRFLALVVVLVSFSSYAQTGYKLDFHVKGLKDTTIYLGSYYGEQTVLKDTARVNAQGSFTFEGTKNLAEGIYYLVLKNNKLPLDFVIGKDQQFSIETDTEDYTKHAKINGDEDNVLFQQNATFLADAFKEADPLVKILKDSTISEDGKKSTREAFQKISEKVLAYQKNLIDQNPTTMTARLLNATRDVIVPEAPRKDDGSVDSTWQFKYYRTHYFDNFDLADDAMLRLPKPMYAEKVKDYFDRLFVQQPDTILKEINRIAASVKKNKETYKYFIWTCVIHYQNHKGMGLDEVYVKLYDKYLATGEMDYWIDKKTKGSIKDYVDKIRISLVGMTAPNLIMQDQAFKAKSMYDIRKKYTILFIFDPDCGHCREETPRLVEFYNKNRDKFDFEVYAVSIDTSMKKMRDFIKEFKTDWITVNGPRTYVGHYTKHYYAEQTPSMYIIDEKRKIIAKKLPVDMLPEFFEKYTRLHQKGT
jgi:peroxiredoxin